MTSKQAIKLLTAPYKHIECQTCREMFDTIKKDLEVLDILKEFEVDIATVNQFDKYETYVYIQKRYRAKAMSYEQWLIVKEWLKND